MDHPSGRRQRLREAMEACRDNGRDLSDPQFANLAAQLAEDPELRAQFQRLQEADGAIKVAFAKVTVPTGLANRVSQRLAEAAQGSAETVANASSGAKSAAADSLVASAAAAPVVTSMRSPAPLRRPAERYSRRRLLVGFTALSAAAVLLAAVWFQTYRPRYDTPSRVLSDAMDFFAADNQPFGPLVSRVAPPAEYPLSRDIAQKPDIRWRPVQDFLGVPAVAYDLPTSAGRATLYVLQRNVDGLPAFPPDSPSLSTGGKSAAAWQVGSTLYVLVMEGDAWMYSNCLDHSHGPLT